MIYKRLISIFLSVSTAIMPVAPAYADLIFKKNVKDLVVSGGSPVGTAGAELSTSSLNFGSVPAGQSATLSARLLSTGSAPLSIISAPQITGNAAYSSFSNCSGSLASGSYCDIQVTYGPTGINAAPATLTISTNAGLKSIGLTGTGSVGLIELTAVDSTNFGTVSVGASSSRSFTVHNTGNTAVSSISTQISGSGFSLGSTTCTSNLGADGNCSFVVNYTPSSVGSASGNISISSSAYNGAQSLALSATSVATPTPGVSMSSSSLAFSALPGHTDTHSVRLTNTGNAPLSISGVSLSDSNSAFTVASNCGASLAAGAYCDTSLDFTPTAVGNVSATLTFDTNAGVHVVSLSGAGEQPMTVSASSLLYSVQAVDPDFGTVAVGTSTNKHIYLLIAGYSGQLMSSATITGANASEFSFVSANKYHIAYANEYWASTGACGATVSATNVSTCTADAFYPADKSSMYPNEVYLVKFQPTSAGTKSATLTIAHNGSNASPVTFTLSGTATAQPVTSLSTTSVSFGNVDVGNTATQTARITNIGTASLNISALNMSGSTAYSVTSENCVGQAINPGNYCDVSIQFAPVGASAPTGVLSVVSNAASSGEQIVLTGTGLKAIANVVAASGSSADFGQTAVGSTNSNTFLIQNIGNKAMSGLSVQIDGSAFTISSSSCGTTLSAGQSCSVTVVFSPSSAGQFTQFLTATSSNATSAELSLQGSGSGTGIVNISAASLDFGNVNVGSSGTLATVLIYNSGNVPFSFNSVPSLTGTGASSFTDFATTCGATLAAGASCQVSVNFGPTAIGQVSASISINTSVGTGTVSLSGTGTASYVQLSVKSGSSANFGSVITGQSQSETFVVTNTGNITATVAADIVGVSGTAPTILNNGCASESLGVNASCEVTVQYSPAGAETMSANFVVVSTALNGPNHSIALSGNGQSQAVADLSATTMPFGTVDVGSTYQQSLILKNLGGAPLTVTSVPQIQAGSSVMFKNLTTSCSAGLVLTTGSQCTISVDFGPTAGGTYSGTLAVVTSVQSFTVNMSGTGATAVASLAVSSGSSSDFGAVAVGGTPVTRNFTFTNTGNKTATGVYATVAGSSDLAIVNPSNCGTQASPVSIVGGGTCSITVQYAPSTVSTLTGASVSVASSASNGTVSVSLTGSGTGSGVAQYDVSTLSFTNVVAGTTSAEKLVTLTNQGNVPLTITSAPLLTGADKARYTISSTTCTLNASIAAGATCTIGVTFSPINGVGTGANLNLSTSSNGAKNITLIGTGLYGNASYNVNSIAFGSTVYEGTTSSAQTVTLTNNGTDALTISAAPSLGGTDAAKYAIVSNTCTAGATIAISGTCSFGVTFTPANTSATTATVSITTSTNGVKSISLSGTGLLAPSGESVYTSTGTSSFTVPAGVYSLSVVAVGGGGGGILNTSGSGGQGRGGGGGALAYVNSISVTPGETLTVVVGAGAPGRYNSTVAAAGGDSYVQRGSTYLVQAGGGPSAINTARGTGGAVLVGSGGAGGNGGTGSGGSGAGGGGAGGYSGAGGAGGTGGGSGGAGSGGGAGGGASGGTTSSGGGGGGGTGIGGSGTSGVKGTANGGGGPGGGGGSTYTTSTSVVTGGNGSGASGAGGAGGFPGGGGGGRGQTSSASAGAAGANGAVRIIWGSGQNF